MKHMNAELVTKDFLKETLSHEFEKFSTILVTEFGRIDDRFNKVDIRFDRVEGRFDKVENRLVNVENRLGNVELRLEKVEGRLGSVEEGISSLNFRLGNVENNLFELTETVEAEMEFTSDLRDNLNKRVGVLERKRS